jgi:hypothetical protein
MKSLSMFGLLLLCIQLLAQKPDSTDMRSGAFELSHVDFTGFQDDMEIAPGMEYLHNKFSATVQGQVSSSRYDK